MTLTETIKIRIENLCKEKGITYNKLSYICGMSQSTLSNILNGYIKKPTVSTIKKVCDGLEITLAEFFDTEEFNNLEQEIV